LDVDEGILGHPKHALEHRKRCPAAHQVWPPDHGCIQAVDGPVINWQYVILERFRKEEILQLFKLRRILFSEVVRQAEVRARVVQLPDILLERTAGLKLPRGAMD